MSRKILVGAALAVTAMFFAGAFAYDFLRSEGWYERSIEHCDVIDSTFAMAVDRSDTVHIVYHCMMPDRSGALRYAVGSGGHWDISTVASVSWLAHVSHLKIFVGEDSTVHIAWRYSGDTDAFGYAFGTGGNFEVIYAGFEEFFSGAVAIDSAGVVHGLCVTRHPIFDSQFYQSEIEYVYQHWTVSSGTWVLNGTYVSPILTEEQLIYQFIIHDQDDPRVFIRCSGVLIGAIIDDSGIIFDEDFDDLALWEDTQLTDAEFDSGGSLHLLLRSEDPQELLYWQYDGQGWLQESIGNAGDHSWGTLYVDPQDRVFAAYSYDFDGMRRWEVAEKNDNGWAIRSLRESSVAGWPQPHVVVDSQGVYHVIRAVSDGNMLLPIYANTDVSDLSVKTISNAGFWTVIAVVIGLPIAFIVAKTALAAKKWYPEFRHRRGRREGIGLYEKNLRKNRRKFT